MRILAWHFLAREKVEAGRTYTFDGEPFLCGGQDASIRALDALGFASGSMVCRVEVGGWIKQDANKLVGTERIVLWMADATATLHEFGAWAADWILDRLEVTGKYEIDPRSRAAIMAKRRWLKGEITDQELAAARAAAWDAVWAAAEAAAQAAAEAAAWAAELHADEAAAEAADRAVWAADRAADRGVWAAARGALNRKLEEMLTSRTTPRSWPATSAPSTPMPTGPSTASTGSGRPTS